jgi:hypothetical protein
MDFFPTSNAEGECTFAIPWMNSDQQDTFVGPDMKFTQAGRDAAIAYKKQRDTPAPSSTPGYETIKGQYATYALETDASTRMKNMAAKLKVRSPVQPHEIPNLRSEILKPRSLAVIQTVLFTILLALIEFMVLPSGVASHVVFLTLCVGAAAGIYLSNR